MNQSSKSTKFGLYAQSLKNATFEILKVQKRNLYQLVCHPKKLVGTKSQLCTYFGQVTISN